MGFFSDITGKTAKKALQGKARSDLQASQALGNSLNQTYGQLGDAQKQGLQHVVDSYGTARDTASQGYDATKDYLTPYSQTGRDAGDTISNALGQNGQQAQQDYYSGVQGSAGFQSGLNAGVDDLMSRYGVTSTNRVGEDGLARSGRVLKGLQSYGNRYTNDYVDNQLNRLGTFQSQGYNADSQLSNITNSYYGNQANLDIGEGQAQNQYYQVPAQTVAQGQLGQANAIYQGQMGYNSGMAQGQIAKSNATNNLLTQGLSLGTKALGYFNQPKPAAGGSFY